MHPDVKNPGFATRAIHAGQHPDPATGAIATPVYQTSTYAQPSPGVFKENFDYARSANPTRSALEANIASLENGAFGISFASGVASLAATLLTLRAGDHVVLCDDVYGGTYRVYKHVFEQFGLLHSITDMTDHDAVRAAISPATKLVWLETPTNPTLKIIDIAAIAKICKDKGALLAVDNTFASPYLQSPLALGANIVSHSCTKYIGGHADVVGGVLVVNDRALADKLHYVQNAVGGVPGPWDCYLLLRSTKTLAVRMRQHCENAMAVAKYLADHKAVEKTIYPGLESHPQHALARRQMSGFGGMVSFVLKDGLPAARRFLERVRIFTLAESLGGVESLCEHPAIMTHATVPPEQRAKLGISDGLVRLSVGIETSADQIADLEQALS